MELKKDFYIEVKKLSTQFYLDYKGEEYSELLSKEERAYCCFIIKCRDYYICVPYRTNISRNNAYFFTSSKRSKTHKSGLDYEKIVIITDIDTYLDNSSPTVDNDEYIETIISSEKIVSEVLKYVDNYVKHCKGVKKMHPREFARKYQYTTLQYFHEQLKI